MARHRLTGTTFNYQNKFMIVYSVNDHRLSGPQNQIIGTFFICINFIHTGRDWACLAGLVSQQFYKAPQNC